jgi:hypothetical protein
MSVATLYIQQNHGHDEIISFGNWSVPGMYEVRYRPSDLPKTSYVFYMDINECEDYIYRTLKLLSLDTSPFHCVQVTTRMTPSVLFEIADLDDSRLRRLVEDTVLGALRTNPRSLKE